MGPDMTRTAVARALGLEDEGDLRLIHSLATHVRSEVVVMSSLAGARVVAKQFRDGDAELRFEAEISALRALKPTAAPIPHLLGEDRDDLLIVMDFVDGPSVEDMIRGSDRDLALRHLVSYARAIRTLHRIGRSVVSNVAQAREGRGHPAMEFWPPFARDARAAVARLTASTDAPSDRLTEEVGEVVERAFQNVGNAATLIQWDNWPGNSVAASDKVILVDLENAMRGDGLLDVSSWHLAFPPAPLRLPLADALPDAVVAAMDQEYQDASGLTVEEQSLAFAMAARMLYELTTPSAPKLVAGTLDPRIQVLYAYRLRRAAATLERAAVLPALGTLMSEVAARVTSGEARVGVYPAFSASSALSDRDSGLAGETAT